MKTYTILPSGQSEYTVNGVRYLVSSAFVHTGYKNGKRERGADLRERMRHLLQNGFADLPIPPPETTIDREYVCSTAGKGEENAVEKE